MKIQNNILLVGFVLVCFFELGLAQKANCTTKKPTLTTDQSYTMNQNCTMGPTYNTKANGTTPAQHCNCWSNCGYICSPMTSGKNCTAPTVPSGTTWVANVGCTNGTTYNTPTPPTHCNCYKRCGYMCKPK